MARNRVSAKRVPAGLRFGASAGVLAAVLFGGTASSAVITASQISPGSQTDTAQGFTFEANERFGVDSGDFEPGGTLADKGLNGETGIGINESDGSPGDTGGEIDRDERLDVFASDRSAFEVPGLSLTFLYPNPRFEDPNEGARVSIADGSGSEIEAVEIVRTGATDDPTNIEFDGSPNPSLVENITAASEADAARVDIGALFDSQRASELRFSALNRGGGPDDFSDFSVAQVDVQEVPAPNALALLGVGLVGLGVAARKRGGRSMA